MKTMDVVDLLEISYWTLIGLLRARLIPVPKKDRSGDYVWSQDDFERVQQALRQKRKRRQKSKRPSAL